MLKNNKNKIPDYEKLNWGNFSLKLHMSVILLSVMLQVNGSIFSMIPGKKKPQMNGICMYCLSDQQA